MIDTNRKTVEILREMLEAMERDKSLNLKQIDDSLYLFDEFTDRISYIIVETTSRGWEMYEPDEPICLNEL